MVHESFTKIDPHPLGGIAEKLPHLFISHPPILVDATRRRTLQDAGVPQREARVPTVNCSSIGVSTMGRHM